MKRIISFILVALMLFNATSTLAAGLHNTYFVKYDRLSDGLDYTTYIGEDSSARRQRIHILDYVHGKDVLPLVSYGTSLLSHKTVSSMLKSHDNAVAGINGDFYSFYTGIPMSTVISDGILLSSNAGNNAIGFLSDGCVIIGNPDIKTVFTYSNLPEIESPDEDNSALNESSEEITVTEGVPEQDEAEEETVTDESAVDTTEESVTEELAKESVEEVLQADGLTQDGQETVADEDSTETEIDPIVFDFNVYYNKYPTVYAVYLTDRKYSKTTDSTFSSKEIVIRSDGDMKIGSELIFTVEDVYSGVSDTAIPEGAMVLTVPDVLKGSKDFENVAKGDKLVLKISAADGWDGVITAVGGGDIIVDNGAFLPETVNEDHEKYRNARTAVGVREDNSVLFVAVDGDGNDGAGMTYAALAEFMIGEGAVKVLNLDGGGSTTVAVSFPGNNQIKVTNTPKDGAERRVSNSVLFLNNSENGSVPSFVALNSPEGYLLEGEKYSFAPTVYSGDRSVLDASYLGADYALADGTSVDGGVYVARNATYNERVFAMFDFGEFTIETSGLVNVTDRLDSILLDKNFVIVNPGDTFSVSLIAERYGIPVQASLNLFEYSDNQPIPSPQEDRMTAETDTATDELNQSDIQTNDDIVTEDDNDSILFENDYMILYYDGTVVTKSVSLFSETELKVSYKDVSDILKIYFGLPDNVLEDFENENPLETVFDSQNKSLVKGYRSDNAVLASDGKLAYTTPVTMNTSPKYFSAFVQGESVEDLMLVLLDGEKQIFVPYSVYKDYSELTGWVQLIAEVPDGISEAVISVPAISMSNTPFSLDGFIACYGWSADPFDDINGLWSYDYVMQIYDMGIVNGYVEDGRTVFKPENNITRAEFAKMVSSYLALDIQSYEKYGTEFADAESIPEWCSQYIMALSNEGYMNGKSHLDGGIYFEPEQLRNT